LEADCFSKIPGTRFCLLIICLYACFLDFCVDQHPHLEQTTDLAIIPIAIIVGVCAEYHIRSHSAKIQGQLSALPARAPLPIALSRYQSYATETTYHIPHVVAFEPLVPGVNAQAAGDHVLVEREIVSNPEKAASGLAAVRDGDGDRLERCVDNLPG
jgi:hypothetical protein